MRVIADQKIPFLKGILEPYCNIEYLAAKDITKELVKDADALIIRTRTLCNADLLNGSKVKFIVTATIGFDHIDTEYCEKNGIVWTNCPGCNAGSVMQYMAAAFAHLATEKGFYFVEKSLGVVGVGHVGTRVVRLAETLGMRVFLNDPPLVKAKNLCGYISFDGILRESDIISFHTPLTYSGEFKTFHLLDEKKMQKVNKGTIIINTSRGEVVDNLALLNSLQNGRIDTAVVDVWENEPALNVGLLDKSAIGTSHIAGYSADGKANATFMSVKALNNFFRLGIDKIKIDIPQPQQPLIEIDCSNMGDQQVICNAILHTYPISSDSNMLKSHPQDFESYRENYAVRREFNAYTVKLIHGKTIQKDILKKLGFNVI
ncbi:MAG TPA: 4-phosphoerythronate dehydrogenase PdxB [Bacteroidales bacterium]|nr:4-phosphoerythronate dehydrogenase PdxB [Bacteroidales bacterium]